MRLGVCAVILLLMLVSFGGCSEDSDDEEELWNYVYGYEVKTDARENESYRLILPILMNNSGSNHREEFILDELKYPPPEFNFTNGSGDYSFIDTEYGRGVEIVATGSIYLRGVSHERHPYGDWSQDTFLSLVINQSGNYSGDYGTPFLFYAYFEGMDGMQNITITLFRASLSFQSERPTFYKANIHLENGWNEIIIYYKFWS